MSDSLGTIEKEKRADFALLNRNSLTDISNTKGIYAVMTNGKFFSLSALDKLKTMGKKNNSSLK